MILETYCLIVSIPNMGLLSYFLTNIRLRSESTHTAFTAPENVRTALVQDLTDDTDEFYRFNRLDANKRYYQIIGTGTGVLSLNKFFVFKPDWRVHRHKDISTSDTGLDGAGDPT